VDTSVDAWAEGPGLLASVRRYAGLIAMLAFLGAAIGIGWSLVQPTQYSGTVVVVLDDSIMSGTDPGRLVRSRADAITSDAVLQQALSDLGGGMSLSQFADAVEATPSTDSNVITITALGPTGPVAARRAEAVVRAYHAVLDRQTQQRVEANIAALDARAQQLSEEIKATELARTGRHDEPVLASRARSEQDALATIDKAKQDLRFTTPSATQTMTLGAGAQSSQAPVSPQPLRSTLLGLTVGVLIGVAAAWGLAGRPSPRPGTEADQQPSLMLSSLPVSDTTSTATSAGTFLEMLESPDGILPRFVAENIAETLGADVVVLLLERDGVLDRVAAIGVTDAEFEALPDPADPDVVRRFLEGGAITVSGAERGILASGGIPGATTDRLVVIPLSNRDKGAFGLALVGRSRRVADPSLFDLHQALPVVEKGAPALHAWWVLRGLVDLRPGAKAAPAAPVVGSDRAKAAARPSSGAPHVDVSPQDPARV
jgi:capsular polysaccharide biosynthesis protein